MTNPSPTQQAKAALKDLVKEAGNPGRLALDLGLTRNTAYAWKILPEAHLKKACEVFGKKPKQLRPDLSDYQIKRLMEVSAAPGDAQPRARA